MFLTSFTGKGYHEKTVLKWRKNVEATSGFEPEMKALQASALPLGHVAISTTKAGQTSDDRP
jgi:hypothetical protein